MHFKDFKTSNNE